MSEHIIFEQFTIVTVTFIKIKLSQIVYWLWLFYKKLEPLSKNDIGSQSAFISLIFSFLIFILLLVFIGEKYRLYTGLLSLVICFSIEGDYYFHFKKKWLKEQLPKFSQKEIELEHQTLLESIKMLIQSWLFLFAGFFVLATYGWMTNIPAEKLIDSMNAIKNDFPKVIYVSIGIWLGIINPYFKYMAFLRGKIAEKEKYDKSPTVAVTNP